MARFSHSTRSMPRLLAVYAVITLVPVVLLGVVLGITFNHEATQRGLAQGRAEALVVAQTAVEPELNGRPLSEGLGRGERVAMTRLVQRAVAEKDVLRLRLRDLQGRVVFSADGTGLHDGVDDEALDAAHGDVVADLTHLNADSNDDDSIVGVPSVEVYLPLHAGTPTRRVGVLEIYLPYTPIATEVRAGLRHLRIDLMGGLAGLYLLLFAITLSATSGLRREVAINGFLATHDALTKLPNRGLFRTKANAAIGRLSSRVCPMTIAIIDLDRFKQINDALGDRSGDRLLIELGARLTNELADGDTVARLGGDEFGLVLHDLAEPEQALHRLREVIRNDLELDGLTLAIESSIGFVSVPRGENHVDLHLRHAEVAMYAAKAQHAGVLRYSPDLEQYDAGRLALVTELRDAITADQLVLHYQPQVDPATGTTTAVEALLRWQHPIHGFVPPGRFLPLAEQTEVIDAVTDWVIARALRDVRAVTELGFDLSVAVNASARSIVRDDFTPRVLRALADAGVSPSRLTVEVTETALMTDHPAATRVLGGLASAGVSVSLDDFGQGQTSLGYLSSLPVNELKIDRSFVTDMNEDDAHAAIVRSVIRLGHNLGMQVVAEGIESADVLSSLQDAECDLAQGFHIARPMPLEQLGEWLRKRASDRSVSPPEPPAGRVGASTTV
jgi:diguanylate cyclase (GGDEF)-like protein